MNQQWTHRISSPAGRAAVTLTALLALGTGASRAANIYWDSDTNGANNNISTGAGLGAAGNWNNLASGTPLVNWWPGSGTTDQTWVNGTDTAIFWGTAGTVKLTDTITVGGLRFDTTGYTISATGYALTFGAGSDTIALNNIAAATVTGAVGGTGAVTITNMGTTAGTLTLNGTSTAGWSGATTISNVATLALSGSN